MADQLRELFGSDEDSDDNQAPSALRISPAEDKSPVPLDHQEVKETTPAAESDVEEGDEAPGERQPTSGFTRVPSDVEGSDTEPTIKTEDGAVSSQPAASSQPDVEPEDEEETRVEVTIPRLEPNFEGRHIYWKAQDFVRADANAFKADDDDEFEDFDEDPPLEIQQAMRQAVKTTMRWRWTTGDSGDPMIESNTKFIKWSDGSHSLVIGDEYFDVSFIPLKGEHHQLFLRQGTGLQGGVVLKEKMILRPAVTNPLLRKSRMSVGAPISTRTGAQMEKTRQTMMAPVGQEKDPEKHRAELMKKEDERLKASIRRETQQRRVRDSSYRGITSGFLEGNDEEDDNTVSLSAIKNSYKRGDFTRPVYSDEEDDDEPGDSRRKKLETAKDLDDDDDDFGIKKKKTDEGGAKKRVAVVSDDEE